MHCNKEKKQKQTIMKKTLLIIFTLLIALAHQAQNKQTMNNGPYASLWKQVEEMEKNHYQNLLLRLWILF